MSVLLNPSGRALAEFGGVMSGTHGPRHGPYHMPGYAGPLSLKTMRRGRGVWIAGGRSFVVEPGCALLLDRGQRYAFTIEGDQEIDTFCPFFAHGLVREAVRARSLGHGALLHLPIDTQASVPAFALRLRRLGAATEAAVSRLRAALHTADDDSALFDLLDRLLDELESDRRAIEAVSATRAATREQLYRQIHRAVEYAHADVAGDLSLDVLAQAAVMSPYHFHRTFREIVGQTPARYVTAMRLDRAWTMLVSSRRSVTEISIAVGFGSLGSFSSAFVRRFGVSPSAARRDSQAGRSAPTPRLPSSSA